MQRFRARLLVQQRPGDQPVEQCVAIGRREDLVERVVVAHARLAEAHGQQMQIVIAEHHGGGIAQRADPAQHLERVGAAIHQIADQPEPVAVGGEFQAGEQRAQFRVAALHIADRIKRHQAPMA